VKKKRSLRNVEAKIDKLYQKPDVPRNLPTGGVHVDHNPRLTLSDIEDILYTVNRRKGKT
jgi:hypothetical protein